MESLDNIQSLIRTETKGAFDEQDYEDLQVVVRIAGEFKRFLDRYDREAPEKEIAYISDTIRSGMDQFFALAHSCSVIERVHTEWQFRPCRNWNYHDLRRRFLDKFDDFASPNRDGLQRLSCLLELTHIELVFLAAHFPLTIFKVIAQSGLSPRSDESARSRTRSS